MWQSRWECVLGPESRLVLVYRSGQASGYPLAEVSVYSSAPGYRSKSALVVPGYW
jgi:hypothetical protein